MTRLRSSAIGCALALVASFLLARSHPFGDAGLYAANSGESIIEDSSVPPGVRTILIAKCADCHSMQTRSPVYGYFAPASWLMERDIVAARSAMNLSRWSVYSAEEQEALKVKIMLEARAHRMPPAQYRIIHWNARVTDADVLALTQWARGTSILNAVAQEQAEADTVRGKAVFEKRCTGCHAMEQNREGPRLRGVFGRPAASVEGFDYSPALRKAHIVWNEATLEQWLADPDTLVPGNNMEFHVAKAQERQDLIRYLKESGDLKPNHPAGF